MSQGSVEVSPCANAETVWGLQPREEKALGIPYCGLSVPKGRLKGRHRHFRIACCDGTRGDGFRLKVVNSDWI